MYYKSLKSLAGWFLSECLGVELISIATCVDEGSNIPEILVMHLLEIRLNLHRCGVDLGTISFVWYTYATQGVVFMCYI